MNVPRSIRVFTIALILGVPLIGIFHLWGIGSSYAAGLETQLEQEGEPVAIPELSTETVTFLPGTFDGIDFSGKYAFIAESLALTALDISNPTQPVVVGRLFLPTRLYDVKVINESIAYVAGSELYFVDISDPATMELLGSLPEYYGRKIEIREDLAFITGWTSDISVFHIAKPLAPILISVYGGSDWVRDIEAHGDYVFLVRSNQFEIAKIEESGILSLTGLYAGLGYARELSIEGDLVYIADQYKGLVIIDAEDLTNPLLLSIYDHQDPFTVAVKEDVAYIEDYFLGLILIDVSEPSQPQFISNDASFRPNRLYVTDNLLFLFSSGSPNSLAILDISEPAAPVFQAEYSHVVNSAEKVIVSGNLLFTIEYGGFVILDISDPLHPSRLGFFEHMYLDRWRFMIEGDRAYVRDNGLMILDISDPANPVQIGAAFVYSYEPTAVEDMVVYHAFNTTPWGSNNFRGELQVIDTHNPISTTLVYTTQIAGAPGEIDSIGGILAIELIHNDFYPDPETLQLFDLSNPMEPALSGSIQSPFANITDIEITGDLLFFSGLEGGLGIVDISNLEHPMLIGLYPEQWSEFPYDWGLEVIGDRVYSHFGETIQVLNVADPTQPSLIGQYSSEANIVALARYEDLTILARGFALEFIRIEIPTLFLPGVFSDFGP